MSFRQIQLQIWDSISILKENKHKDGNVLINNIMNKASPAYSYELLLKSLHDMRWDRHEEVSFLFYAS